MHKCRLKTSAQNADVTLLLKPKQQLSENQRPQEAQGGAYQTVNPMPHPESASSPLRANGVLPLINRRQLVVGAVASTAAATCQCCKEPFAQASEWAYGEALTAMHATQLCATKSLLVVPALQEYIPKPAVREGRFLQEFHSKAQNSMKKSVVTSEWSISG